MLSNNIIIFRKTAFIILFSLGIIADAKAQVAFVDAADSLGVDFDYGDGSTYHTVHMGGGVSFFDFNGDGWDDLTFAGNNSDTIQFFQNTSGSFTKLTPLINFAAETKHVLWVDYDNDGDNDLFVTSVDSGNRLFENTGFLNFSDVTVSSGIGTTNYETFSASFGDYDHDGYLDLYISNYLEDTAVSYMLYHNNANGTFLDVTASAGLFDTTLFSMASVFFDYNEDGWPDIYATSDFTNIPNTLYRNNKDGTFTNVTTSTNADPQVDAMCATVDDYDNDMDLDVYVTSTPFTKNSLMNFKNGSFGDSATASGAEHGGWCWGSVFLDADNDMDLDLYVSSAYLLFPNNPSALLVNGGSANFSKSTYKGFDKDTAESFSNAVGDFNKDGKGDIAVSNQGSNAFLWANTSGASNYVSVELEGTVSNRMGIGSNIIIHTSLGSRMRQTMCGEGMLGQNSQYEIFGIDTVSVIDSVVIDWISGHKDVLYNVNANQRFSVLEGSTRPISNNILANDSLFESDTVGICIGDSIQLSSQKGFTNYQWSTGDSSDRITVSGAGWYHLSAWIGNGPVLTDSIYIKEIDLSHFSIGPVDTSFCPGNKLSSNIKGDAYLWDNGWRGRNRIIFASGQYWLEITQELCKVKDTSNVNIFNVEKLDLGNDTAICQGSTYMLDPGGSWTSFLWSDSSTSSTLAVTDSGEYWLLAGDSNGCSKYDQIVIDTKICSFVDEYLADDLVSIFPNPLVDELYIENPSNEFLIYRIVDMQNTLLKEGTLKAGSNRLMLENVVSGSYVLVIQSTSRGLWQREKLIIKSSR